MKSFLPIAAACLAAGAIADDAAAQAAPAEAAAIEESREAVMAIDAERLGSDRDYAAEILRHLDRLAPTAEHNAELRDYLSGVRLFALVTLDRREDVAAVLDRALERRSRLARDYIGPVYAALTTSDHVRAVALVESASRQVPGVAWAELREGLGRDNMGMLLHQLARQEEPGLRVRLAEALFRIGWPGDGDVSGSDHLRTILLEDRLARGDRAAAAEIAAGLSSVDSIVGLIVQPRYDDVLAPGRDRLEVLRAAVAAEDQVIAGPRATPQRLLTRVHFLRGAGRNEDVLSLLQPHIADVPATVAASDEGMWLINEAAYALVALGRDAEAVALMRQLADLPIGDRIDLIGPVINYAEILFQTGRAAEALEHATWLDREASQYANDYGKMWIASAIACSLARLDRAAEAEPQIERLREHSETNPAALTQAYLCLGMDDAAAELMIERLQRDDPRQAILALQDYSLSSGPAQTGTVYDRLAALRERPDVRAALDRVGRVLILPLARSYWGNF